MVDYLEIEDYGQEQFFEMEENWDEYESIIQEWVEPSPKDKDLSYNIFTLEQAISTINELGKASGELTVAANSAVKNIDNFIKIYSEAYGKQR